MTDSQITILMPAYNAERTIAESIDSVLNQTHQAWTLLVLDDGSTDATPAVVAKYLNDDRVRYLKQPHRGLCGTLNYGLQTANTDWIARIDTDDLWHAEHLSRQLETLSQNPSAQIIGTWGERINDRGEHLTTMNLGPASEDECDKWRAEKRPFYFIHSSILARRTTLMEYGGYREADYPAEDVYLWTRVAQKHLVLSVPDNLTSYRITCSGISAQSFFRQAAQSERLEFELKTGRQITLAQFEAEMLSKYPLRFGFLRRSYARYWFRQGGARFVNGRRLSGMVLLAGSLCLNPMSFVKRAVSHT